MTDTETQALLARLQAESAWLHRLARSLAREDADDVTQETWIAAVRNPPEPGRPLRPWLGRIASNLAIGYRRSRDRRLNREAVAVEEATPHVPSAYELLERMEMHRQVGLLLAGLDDPFRETVLLRYIEGLSAAEIARRQGVPAGTVRWRLREGIDRLRRALDVAYGGRERWRALLLPLAPSARTGEEATGASAGAITMATGWTKTWIAGVMVALVLLLGGLGWRRSDHDKVEASAGPDERHRPRARLGVALVRPAATGTVIEGTVHDPSGRPLPEAMVALSRTRSPGETLLRGIPLATATTDQEGRYRFDDPWPGEYQVSATAPEWRAVTSPIFSLAAGQQRRVDLTLRADGHVLEGRVLDEGGGPVPGARVSLALGYPWSWFPGTNPRPPLTLHTVADDQGRYQLRLEPREYELRVHADGYAPIETTVAVTRGVNRDLRLHPAARISGIVVEKTGGQPVAGAEVRLWGEDGRQTTTDAQGRFAFGDVSAGSYHLSVRHAERNLVGAGPRVTAIPTQSIVGIDVALEPGVSLSGIVLDRDGNPVGGAALFAHSIDRTALSGLARALSAPDGSFTIPGIVPGRYLVRVEVAGDGSALTEHSVDVGPVGTKGFEIRLGRPGVAVTVAGRVLDGHGRPVAGVLVRADPAHRPANFPLGSGETAEDGSFRIGASDTETVRITAWHPVHGFAHEDLPPVSSETPLELRLGPGASIVGRVRYEDGTPAVGVSVAATRQKGTVVYDSATTDDAGRFRIRSLSPGLYTVYAVRKRGPWALWTSVERPSLRLITLENDAQGTVDLELRRGGRTISGTVVFENGRPAPGTLLVANGEENGRSWRPRRQVVEHAATTREDGRFTIDDVEDGTFSLWALRPGFPETEAHGVAADRTDVRVTLDPPASIAGVVVGSDGRPVRDFAVAVVPAFATRETPPQRLRRMEAERKPPEQIRDPGGAFEVSGLAAGTYQVKVTTAEATGGATEVVTVARGERKTDLRMTVATGLTVTGTVVYADTESPGASLSVIARVANRWLETKTDAAGAFALRGLLADEQVAFQFRTEDRTVLLETINLAVPRDRLTVDLGLVRLKSRRQDATKRIP